VAAPAAPALHKALKNPDTLVHLPAAGALVQMGQEEDTLFALLVKAFQTPDQGNDPNSIDTVGEMGIAAVPVLMRCLHHKHPRVRLKATEGFAYIAAVGSRDRMPHEAVLALRAALKDEDKAVVANAIFALASIRHLANEGIPAVIELLKDSDDDVRWSAASNLRWFGRDAAGAIPALREALKDANEQVRRAAAESLEALTKTGKKE
jgi:HEAT repeat protein